MSQIAMSVLCLHFNVAIAYIVTSLPVGSMVVILNKLVVISGHHGPVLPLRLTLR